VIPVLTPAEMGEVDRDAPEPVEVLVRRAAGAVARAATGLLGSTYGRRVVVVAGPGNNGWDGRVAGQLLAAGGAVVHVVDALDVPPVLPTADLVIDAAFGTGFRGSYSFPDTDGAPVLAVDIPSGLSGSTGVASGAPARAVATVTFAALKPGLVLGDGPAYCGTVTVADIGLEVVARASMHLVEPSDPVVWVPDRGVGDHKWRHAVWLVAGSAEMPGAARLAATAALRGGAGYVRLSTPGVAAPDAPTEVVSYPVDVDGWAEQVVAGASRVAALAIGPGLGRSEVTVNEVRRLAAAVDRPLVVDGDALAALGVDVTRILADRPAPTVLTPHDGEFAALTGAPPGEDRVAAARSLARDSGAVVLLKGPTTVVAAPDGRVLLVRAGDQRLATAGTGDVLTGLVAAHLALGAAPLEAAAAAAQVHGDAALLGARRGLVASDLVDLVPLHWEQLLG
jgi:ADP-dependent NAD(P)H-hydrate dehydratase / NAD(P)H-hydrate epimerase